MLVSDQATQAVRKYPELTSDSEVRSLHTELDISLTLLAVKNESPNIGRPTCSEALRSMVPTMRVVFPHVEALDHQIVNPASSAVAEK